MNPSGFNPRARTGRDLMVLPVAHVGMFQSTRPHGARPRRRQPHDCNGCFNPRARTGRDIHGRRARKSVGSVSIHAPARGATQAVVTNAGGILGFNPRARTGRDLSSSLKPRGQTCFNPRARTGRDPFAIAQS